MIITIVQMPKLYVNVQLFKLICCPIVYIKNIMHASSYFSCQKQIRAKQAYKQKFDSILLDIIFKFQLKPDLLFLLRKCTLGLEDLSRNILMPFDSKRKAKQNLTRYIMVLKKTSNY